MSACSQTICTASRAGCASSTSLRRSRAARAPPSRSRRYALPRAANRAQHDSGSSTAAAAAAARQRQQH
eukprot:3719332-Prymnesium_polylepis.1